MVPAWAMSTGGRNNNLPETQLFSNGSCQLHPEVLLPLFAGRSRKVMFNGTFSSVIPGKHTDIALKIQNCGNQTSAIT
jgi:hypothetical protein